MIVKLRCPRSVRGMAVCILILASQTVEADTFHVTTSGSDGADGSESSPWRTLQHAADRVNAGDTVVVHAGNYTGFNLSRSGTADAPITFLADAGAIIDRDNPNTSDGINIEGSDWVVIDGFEIIGASRAGIRAVLCGHVTIRRVRADLNQKWGIFTGFCDDLVIEHNECSRSVVEHGIYASNSGDRPVIRGNYVWGNRGNGIHLNGDRTSGGDGIISNALVEGNVVADNGVSGGSGINCDGVQDSIIQNNLLVGNHASGISLYRIDGGGTSTGNLVVNNTVLMASDSRWALNIQSGSTDTTVLNNILWSEHSWKGSIDISADSLPGFQSDYNVLMNRMTTDGGAHVLSLAQWRLATGQDGSALLATPDELFVDTAEEDFNLTLGSPALDAGTSEGAPFHDLDGETRPQGLAFDIGAFESQQSPPGGGLDGADDSDAGYSDSAESDVAGDLADSGDGTPTTDSTDDTPTADSSEDTPTADAPTADSGGDAPTSDSGGDTQHVDSSGDTPTADSGSDTQHADSSGDTPTTDPGDDTQHADSSDVGSEIAERRGNGHAFGRGYGRRKVSFITEEEASSPESPTVVEADAGCSTLQGPYCGDLFGAVLPLLLTVLAIGRARRRREIRGEALLADVAVLTIGRDS